MLTGLKKILVLSIFSLLIIGQNTCFAYYAGYWDYHGSGRDHAYSAYIDRSYYIGYADYTPIEPDYVEWNSPPVQTTQIPAVSAAQQDEFTINIPNYHGGYTTVVIKRSGNGFTGPQGEFYPEFPKIFQLKMIYGK
jgi:hypothetical protein